MSNQVDSEAHFGARAKECGIADALLARLRANGIVTMGMLAFAVFRPGADFDEQTFNLWARDINRGVAPTMAEMAALRRLHFESEVILTSTLRASVEQSDSSTPKSLPVAERTLRLQQLRARLAGVNIQGANEPSQTLLDECCHQHETQTRKHIEASRCTSRESEIQVGRWTSASSLTLEACLSKRAKQCPTRLSARRIN